MTGSSTSPRERQSGFSSGSNRAGPDGTASPSSEDEQPAPFGHFDAGLGMADPIEEQEIAHLKRYEDFSTIDWVQDAAKTQLRRRIRRDHFDERQRLADRGLIHYRPWGERAQVKVRQWYEAAQTWVVLTLVGAVIGLNASFLAIVTDWLSDIRVGHCKTGFYLSEKFCCWGEDREACLEWEPWSGFGLWNYFVYLVFGTAFISMAATLVKEIAPYAAGSGVSEIKCIIAGFVMKDFLGFRTLLIKSLALPLTIASGLSVGKEGPSVHYAVCTGNVISRLFDKYRQDASKTREMLLASAAAGVGVAFGSPIGGVIFSLEEMSSSFSITTVWRSYFCALVATWVFKSVNPLRTGQLVLFTVKYDRDWHFFEIIFYIVIGILGGLYGAFVIRWNLRMQAFRKRYLGRYPTLEAVFLVVVTALICYPNMFLRTDMTQSMGELFRECEGTNLHGVCDVARRWPVVFSLSIATVVRIFLITISYGCKVPAGIFVPSMAAGALFGRLIGTLVQSLHETFPHSAFFASCQPETRCITPGTYAFLGAGAALSGIMHITVSVVVIMFELTGALTYILPTMIVVGVTKATSERLGKGGIADRMIWFNGFPYPHSTAGAALGVTVGEVMRPAVKVIPATGLRLTEVNALLTQDGFQGYPIVESAQSAMLVGYIGLTELAYAIDRQERIRTERGEGADPDSTLCSFLKLDSRPSPHAGPSVLQLGRFVDHSPLTVHPQVALETVMDIFIKMGPRVILVAHRGVLIGLVTVKDCLRFQVKAEYVGGHDSNSQSQAADQSSDHDRRREERLWDAIVASVGWLRRLQQKVVSLRR